MRKMMRKMMRITVASGFYAIVIAAGSLLVEGVWVISDPVACLAPDLKDLNGKAWDWSGSLLGSPYSRLPASDA